MNCLMASPNLPDFYINEIYPNAGQMGFVEFYTKTGFDATSKFGAALLSVSNRKAVVLWLYDFSDIQPRPSKNSYILLGMILTHN